MKLVYAPFKNKMEEEENKKLELAVKKHHEEFFNDPSNFGRPYFPLLITTRLLIQEDKNNAHQ